MLSKKLLFRLQAPAGDADGGGGAAVDRGDDFVVNGIEDDDELPEKKAVADVDEGDDAGDDKDDGDDKGDEKADAKTEAKKGKAIPLDRHEKILAKERDRRETLERELKAFQGGKAVADTNADLQVIDTKILELEREYNKQLTDGEIDKATATMQQIRQYERAATEKASEVRIQAAEARAVERVRYDVALERIESTYPELNVDHDDYDAGIYGEVVDLMQAYQATGKYSPTQALQKAVKMQLGTAGSAQAKATSVAPRIDSESAEVRAAAAKERRTNAVGKSLDAAKRQPPDGSRTGTDSDKLGADRTARDIMKMTQPEFSKFAKDDRALAKARGDFVEG